MLAGLPLVAAAPIVTATEATARAEIRGDLAALVTGAATPDPRLAQLMPGLRAGELAYFVVLDVKNDATRAASIKALGARIFRTYRTVNAFAVISAPVTVLQIADLAWVDWLAPVEVVRALDEPVVDQSRATTADVGAPPFWAQGIIGSGVRIAVLDTGLDPSHPDLDDLDFGRWSSLLPNAPKVVDSRNFNGGACTPSVGDGHGHGTHVAGIAAGSGEGLPIADDNGKYSGIAPGAELAIGKVLTDAGIGNNADLVGALEWAAMPEEPLTGCAIGADVVNLSLGSESRPVRLNSGRDADLVSLTLDRLAVRYGTIFVAALGNSGPYIGSALETPGSAYQAISVAAAAKDYDVNHDDTLSGDTCSGWQHPRSISSPSDNDCTGGIGTQPPSIASFSSRGPSGDLWLRPDLAAPGYNIVSAQAATGSQLGPNDLNIGTRNDPLYATASGTSMAAPATTGSAALVLDAYRRANGGADPSGASGQLGLRAGAATLVRAALMNTAGSGLYESRWILSTDTSTHLTCPPEVDPILLGFCSLGADSINQIINIFRSNTLYEVRNGAADPYVGPLAEGAGKLNVGRAIAALRGGIVIYSAAASTGADAGTGPRDFQGSWQIGAVTAGATRSQTFVLHNAPGAAASTVQFAFVPGQPSDGSLAIPTGSGGWTISLPASASVNAGGLTGADTTVSFGVTIPAGTAPGTYTGAVLATLTNGTVLRIPVFATVAFHDSDPAAGNAPGPQAAYSSARDVFAKDDTLWPSVAGQALGSTADWLVYPVELAANLTSASFAVWDTAAGNETYDLYLYDSNLDLISSSHPFAADGVSDAAAQSQRGPSTAGSPTVVTLAAPPAGRHYVAVSRARIGNGPIDPKGDFGSFRMTLDEVGATGAPAPSFLAYSGDYVFVQGSNGRLAATLTDAAGAPIRGRLVTFTIDGSGAACGTCQAVTNVDGVAQLAINASALTTGIHDVHAAFAGDAAVGPSSTDAFIFVVGAGGPPPPPVGGGSVSGGGWFVPADGVDGPGDRGRVHFALHARSGAPSPTGQLRWRDRDPAHPLDLTLESWTVLVVVDGTVTLRGRARTATGRSVEVEVLIRDGGEPASGQDTIRLRLLDGSYDRAGTLGGGNLQVASR